MVGARGIFNKLAMPEEDVFFFSGKSSKLLSF
jgi:hypothetical protein